VSELAVELELGDPDDGSVEFGQDDVQALGSWNLPFPWLHGSARRGRGGCTATRSRAFRPVGTRKTSASRGQSPGRRRNDDLSVACRLLLGWSPQGVGPSGRFRSHEYETLTLAGVSHRADCCTDADGCDAETARRHWVGVPQRPASGGGRRALSDSCGGITPRVPW
jgi:hypothetical protein